MSGSNTFSGLTFLLNSVWFAGIYVVYLSIPKDKLTRTAGAYNKDEIKKAVHDTSVPTTVLFLAGNIPYTEIKNLGKSQDHTAFIRRKIFWFPNGKLVNRPKKLESLSDYRKKELTAIFQEMKDKSEKISTDVIRILTENPPVNRFRRRRKRLSL